MTDPADFNILVETPHGPMLVNRNDQFIGLSLIRSGEYSSREIDLFKKWVKPGDLVVEVGANIGAFSVAFSKMVGDRGRVLAFEPQRLVFQLLCANLALQQCANVNAQQMAVGAERGTVKIPVLDHRQPGNFGGVAILGKDAVQEYFELVPQDTLDSWGLATCQFVKADVEGMELDVLKGSAQTLARCRPVLYVENDRDDKHDDLIHFLEGAGYDSYWHLPPVFAPDAGTPGPGPVMVSRNILCLPKELDVERDGSRALKTYGNRADGWKFTPPD